MIDEIPDLSCGLGKQKDTTTKDQPNNPNASVSVVGKTPENMLIELATQFIPKGSSKFIDQRVDLRRNGLVLVM